MNRIIRKSAYLICEEKGADQRRGNRAADRRARFHSIDNTSPLLSKS